MARLLGVGLLAAASLSCSAKTPDPPKQSGELGGYTFTYACSDPSDALCDDSSGFDATKFPTVAVGGRFRVTYTYPDKSKTYEVNELAGSTRATIATDSAGRTTITLTRPGWTALLASDQNDLSMIGDVLHVKAAAVDHIEVTGTTRSTGATLTVSAGGVSVGLSTASGTVTLRAVPSLADKTPLAGALPCKWSQTATDVLAITSDPTDNVVTTNIKAFGTAVLHVELGTVAADVSVTLEKK